MQYSGRDFDTTLVEGNKTEDAIKNILSAKIKSVLQCIVVKNIEI